MPNLKEYLLKKKLISIKDAEHLRKAFDVIGDIAILEIPSQLSKKEKVIGRAVLALHKNIKTAYKEASARTGKLRLQKLKWLSGEKRTETVCKENGIMLKLDVAKVYYSPRMAGERERIYRQVKKGETIMVMFSGAGPYVVEIAKYSKAKLVYGVELNRQAHKYAAVNINLNKVEDKVHIYCGDVKKVLPSLKKKYDRIVMPLPKGASEYMELALKYVKAKGKIHFYDFLADDDIPNGAILKVKQAAEKLAKKVMIKKVVKCGQLAPRAYRVCVDIIVV